MLKTSLKLSKDIKEDNVKVFCKKIDKIIKSLIGHKLITFTVIDNKLNFCERIYSNNNKVYPILGQKKMPKNIWSEKVIKNISSQCNSVKTKLNKNEYEKLEKEVFEIKKG